MITTHSASLDDLMEDKTPEARLVNNISRSATVEGKLAELKVHEPEKGWYKVEFYWKPVEEPKS